MVGEQSSLDPRSGGNGPTSSPGALARDFAGAGYQVSSSGTKRDRGNQARSQCSQTEQQWNKQTNITPAGHRSGNVGQGTKSPLLPFGSASDNHPVVPQLNRVFLDGNGLSIVEPASAAGPGEAASACCYLSTTSFRGRVIRFRSSRPSHWTWIYSKRKVSPLLAPSHHSITSLARATRLALRDRASSII